jgi:hypothetical protein
MLPPRPPQLICAAFSAGCIRGAWITAARGTKPHGGILGSGPINRIPKAWEI